MYQRADRPNARASHRLRRVSTDSVAVTPTSAECKARWLPMDETRWRAYLGCDEDLDETAEVVLLCPRCAEREFGG